MSTDITPDIVEVTARPDFFIDTVFANGERRRFDMKPYLTYPAFSQLLDSNCFLKAHIANGTVAWNDKIDLSLDTLYLRGEKIEQE